MTARTPLPATTTSRSVCRPFKPSKLAVQARPSIAQRVHRCYDGPCTHSPPMLSRGPTVVTPPPVAQGGRIRSEVAAEKGSRTVRYYYALLMLLIRIQRELLVSQCYRHRRRADQVPGGLRSAATSRGSVQYTRTYSV